MGHLYYRHADALHAICLADGTSKPVSSSPELGSLVRSNEDALFWMEGRELHRYGP